MNAQKFTQKALETISQAQNIAIENQNQAVTPEHLLYALIDSDGGLVVEENGALTTLNSGEISVKAEGISLRSDN